VVFFMSSFFYIFPIRSSVPFSLQDFIFQVGWVYISILQKEEPS